MGELKPFQQRVVDEKTELDNKIYMLNEFICGNPLFGTLPAAEQERMQDQRNIMQQYSNVLSQRIAAFNQQ